MGNSASKSNQYPQRNKIGIIHADKIERREKSKISHEKISFRKSFIMSSDNKSTHWYHQNKEKLF